MYSEASASLWSNELLQAFGSDPNLGQNTKDTCKRLKFQHNSWRAELQTQWDNIDFPDLNQADIFRMNSTMRKYVASLILQRKNRRNYYTAPEDIEKCSRLGDKIRLY